MKKFIKLILNNKKCIISFIIGGIIFYNLGIYAESTLTLATDVSYDNRKSGSVYDDVQKALEDLYSKAESLSSITCPLGKVCYQALTNELTDNDGDGKVSIGDGMHYTIRTNYNNNATYDEYFRVAYVDTEIVKLLPEHNLLLPTDSAPYPHQDPADGLNPSVFSSSNYWGSNVTANLYVYNSSSTLYTYVEKYRELLESAGVPIKPDSTATTVLEKSVRLLTYDEADAIKSESWSHSQTYWTGAIKGPTYDGRVYGVSSSGSFDYWTCSNSGRAGVRPIIIINLSDF